MLKLVVDTPDFMVVNKPSGMPMHDSANAIIPVAEALFKIEKLWLVHRLDTDTSGCMLLAKNKLAAADLGKQFANKTIQKYYLALIDTKPKKKQGTIRGDMKKSRNGDWKLSTDNNNPAITQFFSFVLKDNVKTQELQVEANLKPAIRLCVIKPISGKTHQIRVALKSLGSSIIGDKRYKGTSSDRLYLHSYVIQFTYNNEFFNVSCLPQTGELFTGQLDSFITQLPKPWLMKWPIFKT